MFPYIPRPDLEGQGSWQEFVVAPAQDVFPIPDSVSDHTAAQFYVNPWSSNTFASVREGNHLFQLYISSNATDVMSENKSANLLVCVSICSSGDAKGTRSAEGGLHNPVGRCFHARPHDHPSSSPLRIQGTSLETKFRNSIIMPHVNLYG